MFLINAHQLLDEMPCETEKIVRHLMLLIEEVTIYTLNGQQYKQWICLSNGLTIHLYLESGFEKVINKWSNTYATTWKQEIH